MFVLKASLDPAARTLLSSFGKEMDAIQSRTAKATVENSRKAISIAAEEARAVVQIHTDADTRWRSAVDAKNAYYKSKLSDEEQRYKESLERRNKAAEEFVKQQNMAVSAHSNNQPISSEYSASAQEAADAIAEFDKLDQQRTKRHEAELKKRLDQEVKAAEKQKQLEERQIARDRSLAESAAKKFAEQKRRDEEALAAAIKQADKIVEADKRKQVALEDASRRFQQQARTAGREVANNFIEMGEAGMRFARGLTMIGLIGEKDLNKVKDALLGVQGAVDILSGLGRILTKTDQIMQGLTKATLAQAAAQKALSLANGASGAAAAGGAAAGGLGALGSMGGVAGGVAAILTGPFGLVAAGAVAVGAALLGLRDTLKDPPKRAAGDNSARGVKDLRFSQWLVLSATSGSSTAQGNETGSAAKKDLIESEKLTNRLDQRAKLMMEANAKDRASFSESESRKSGFMKEQLTIQEAMLRNRYEQGTSAEKTKIIEQEIAKYSKEAIQGTAGARDQVIKWMEKRLSHEREISREQKTAANESLSKSKDLLRSIEDQIRAKRESNMSARESFGMKSDEEQQDILSIKRRVDQGDKSVSPEEISKLRGLSGRTDKQISAFAQSRAKAGGFDAAFGREQRQEVQQLDAIRKKLQVEVKQKTDIVVKIDRDIEAEAQSIAKQINVQQAIQNSDLAKRVQEITTEQAENNRRFKNRTGTTI